MATTSGSHITSRRGGARQERVTPVATAAQMVEIIWALPGNPEFRQNCARVAARYLGGDETLVDEIRNNRRAQEHLAETNPEHPARVFGHAVEHEGLAKMRVDQEMATLDEQIRASKRRCIEEGLASLQRCGLPVDDRDRIRAKDCINAITFGYLETRSAAENMCARGLN